MAMKVRFSHYASGMASPSMNTRQHNDSIVSEDDAKSEDAAAVYQMNTNLQQNSFMKVSEINEEKDVENRPRFDSM